jgi:hypothetical protein
MEQRGICFVKYLALGASFKVASKPNPAFWGKRSMVSFIVSPFSVFADVLFALPSAKIGIEQSSSSVKVQHIMCDRTRPIARGALWTPIGRRV